MTILITTKAGRKMVAASGKNAISMGRAATLRYASRRR
jgi:hypothetical protein